VNADRYERTREIFCRVRGAASSDRAALLESLCADDPDLRSDVHRLLAQDGEADEERFLEYPALGRGFLVGSGAHRLDEVPPASVGRYRVEGILGAGSAATVYRAVSPPPLERPVAVKLLQQQSRGTLADRFLIEQRLLSVLDHPFIAKVFDSGVTDRGELFTVIELIEGGHITEHVRSRALGWRSVVGLVERVAEGLAHAHANGVIHRDLKPANILVEPGDDGPHPKIIDFGVAKQTVSESATLSLQGQVVGTLRYMSPEQLDGGQTGARTDVYALGIVLHELLEGEHPYGGADTPLSELVARISRSELPALTRPPGPWRADLDAVLARACRREASERYATMDAFRMELRRVMDGEPVEARARSAVYLASRVLRRHPRATGAAVAAIAVIGGLGVWASIAGLEAVERRRQLETVLLSMAEDVVLRAEHLSGTHEVRRGINEVLLEAFDEILAVDDARDPLRVAHAIVLLSSASALEQAGRPGSALEQARRAEGILRTLRDERPTDVALQRRYIESLVRVGDLCAQAERGEEGSGFYLDAHRQLARLVATAPDDPGLLDDFCWSHNRLATNGLADDVLETYEERLRLAERLIGLDPTRVLSRFNLCHANLMLATYHDVLAPGGGDAERARPYAVESYRLAVELCESDPQRVEFRRLKILAGQRVARTSARLGMGDPFEIVEALVVEARELGESDPGRRDLIVLLSGTLKVAMECAVIMNDRARELEYRRLIDSLRGSSGP
jgi:tetratricopeptide (TPR) repeat protein